MAEVNYLEPDNRWELWGCKTHKEFLGRFLIKGKFHKDVPDDVVKAYEVVEHLLAHSFFYYPMFDEAVTKTTLIFEMAVKIKCNQLGITFIKKGFAPLDLYIKALEKNEFKGLSKEWEIAKKLRNIYAHPNSHHFMGPVSRFYAFQKIVNILNRIFTDKILLENQTSQLENLKIKTRTFNDGLFKLEVDSKGTLIYKVEPCKIYDVKGKILSLWAFYPVILNFPQSLDDLKIYNPIVYQLTDVKIECNEIKGLDIKSGKMIYILQANEDFFIEAINKFKGELQSATEDVQQFHHHLNSEFISKQVIQFEYDYCWE